MKITKLICDHCGSDKDVKLKKVQVGHLPASFYPETIQYRDIDLCGDCTQLIESTANDLVNNGSCPDKGIVWSVIVQIMGKEDVKDFFNKQNGIKALKEDVEVTAELVFGNIKLGPLLFKNGETKHLLLSPGSERVVLSWDNAVKYCGSKTEFLPTEEELRLIIKYKDLIDLVDPSEKGKFSDIDKDWIWSSSEYGYNTAWIQSPSGGYQHSGNKTNCYWVIPVMRV